LDSAAISFPIFGEDFIFNPPSYISVFGFSIYLYGLFITAGFILAGLYLLKRRRVLELTRDNVLDLLIIAVPCGLLGARIFYILFNASDYFGPGKWHNMLMVREGGLAVYGGVIGGAIAFFVYSRIKKIPVGKLWDAAGFGLFIGQAVGRWGNFFNREAYGTVTDLPWRMGLAVGSRTIYVHPAFLYEMLWNAAGLVLMHIFSGKYKRRYYGQYFLFYVAWYGFGRFLIEGIRIDSLFIQGTDIRISQLLAALSFSTAVVILLRNHIRGYTSSSEFGVRNSELLETGDVNEPHDDAVPLDESTDTTDELPETTREDKEKSI
jgi:phosphatidylglycerol:prolipoprotein diacylglycerol transferase